MHSFANLFTSSKDFISSSINKIHELNTPENFEYYDVLHSSFLKCIENYEKKFNIDHYKENYICSCEIINQECTENRKITKRKIVINMLHLPFSIPEKLIYYVGSPYLIIENTLDIDTKKNKAISVSKNISHETHMSFSETITFTQADSDIIFSVSASCFINILIGMNEMCKKIWKMQYNTFYNHEHMKDIYLH
jgi:hypothetical protein